jgi:LysR family transcriptional activator of nhaA
MVIADGPIPPGINVRGFNHVLGDCGISFLAVPHLARPLRKDFPRSLNGAPLLIPSETNLVQAKLLDWLDSLRIYPHIVGEFDDSALMKVFGQAGTGIFIVPTPIATEVSKHYGVQILGSTEDVREQYYAISAERRISHPAVSAITETAREWLQ